MIAALENLRPFIGNTPLKRLKSLTDQTYVKLEYNNFSGSVKDRAAFNIIYQGIKTGKIDSDTEIVESSSGNFGIALACLCRHLALKFTPVIDPNINAGYEHMLRLLTPYVLKVDRADHTGGYLLTRIKEVERICAERDNIFWPNQYENPDNYLAYFHGLGQEICDSFTTLDYIFIGVSSGGTITGLSQRLKQNFPDIKVIAVDVEGSVIFGQKPKKRHVSGIGASKKPEILKHALIDDIIHVSEQDIVKGCNDLLCKETIFGGASAGASYIAVANYFRSAPVKEKTVLFLCPDRGSAYIDTVYNRDWLHKLKMKDALESQFS